MKNKELKVINIEDIGAIIIGNKGYQAYEIKEGMQLGEQNRTDILSNIAKEVGGGK